MVLLNTQNLLAHIVLIMAFGLIIFILVVSWIQKWELKWKYIVMWKFWKKCLTNASSNSVSLSVLLQGGACAIQMVVQAYVIKYLLFNRPMNSECTMQRWFINVYIYIVFEVWTECLNWNENVVVLHSPLYHSSGRLFLSLVLSMKTVGETEQRKALAAALTDILWTAGEEQTATVCLVMPERCFTPHMDYKLDNFTERVHAVYDMLTCS